MSYSKPFDSREINEQNRWHIHEQDISHFPKWKEIIDLPFVSSHVTGNLEIWKDNTSLVIQTNDSILLWSKI